MKVLAPLLLLLVMACQKQKPNSGKEKTEPEIFLAELIPENQMAHAGIFTPDQKEYYYTLSDIEFSTFTVLKVEKQGSGWTAPDTAFFNTDYNEHGVHFTMDGRQLYFSSTRPVGPDTIPDTWHIWRSRKTAVGWSDPEYVNIPGLSQQLVSHPSTTKSGRLYFHSGDLDYTNLALYFSDLSNGQYSAPIKLDLPKDFNNNCITPFVSPDGSYLLFAKVTENGEELYISHHKDGQWTECLQLNDQINTNNLGNPYVTADSKYLYYATGQNSAYGLPHHWVIRRVRTDHWLP